MKITVDFGQTVSPPTNKMIAYAKSIHETINDDVDTQEDFQKILDSFKLCSEYLNVNAPKYRKYVSKLIFDTRKHGRHGRSHCDYDMHLHYWYD